MTTAVITGGASGFGLALGRAFAATGADVALLDLDGERAATEAAALATPGLGVAVDVASSDSVAAAAAAVVDRFGGVDVVVSNVGVQLFGAVERLTDDEWKWVLDVNVVGSARVARAFLPLLANSASPRLAFTTSASVLDAGARMAAYQSSKFAVWGLAETLRLEHPEIPITVVFPSGMITRHLETSSAAQPSSVARSIGEVDDFQAMLTSNPALAEAVADPNELAARTVAAIAAGTPYLVTHGDLVGPVERRSAALLSAAKDALA